MQKYTKYCFGTWHLILLRPPCESGIPFCMRARASQRKTFYTVAALAGSCFPLAAKRNGVVGLKTNIFFSSSLCNFGFFVSLPRKKITMRRSTITDSIRVALKKLPIPLEGWIFGSEARGDAREDSDIDLLILVDSPTVSSQVENAIFSPLYQIELDTGVLINPLILPKSQWGARISPFFINVSNERIRL